MTKNKNFPNILASFKHNKIKFGFEVIIWILLFASLFSIHSLSTNHHYVPIVLSVVLAVVIFLYILLYGKITIDTFSYVLFFLVYSFLITLIFSKNFGNLKTYITSISLAFVVYQFLLNTKSKRIFVFVYSFSVFVFSLWYLFAYRNEIFSMISSSSTARLGSYFGGISYIANTFLSGVIMSLACILTYKNILIKWIYPFVSIMPISICILSSGSKMAFIGTLLSLIVFLFLALFKKHKVILFIILGAFLVLFFILVSLPIFSSVSKRMLELFNFFSDTSSDHSTMGRLSMFESGIYFWTKYLFTGYGAGGYSILSGRSGYSHSTLSELLCNFGLIGFVIFFGPLIYAIFFRRNKTMDKKVLILFAMGFMLIGLIGTSYLQYKIVYLILAYSFSLISDSEGKITFWFKKDQKVRLIIQNDFRKTNLTRGN